jgi:hypothetical protein
MVPASNDATVGPEGDAGPETDGGSPAGGDRTDPGFDEAALYTVVREAVKDALLDVIGTLLLVGVAFVLVVAGGQAVLASGSTATAAIGVAVAGFGLYLAAATLEIVPPVREWV